jgi:hypothetical protein
MKIINFLSVVGIIISFYLFYGVIHLGFTGPGWYPVLITKGVFIIFIASYILSLLDVKTSLLLWVAFLLTAVAAIVIGMYAVLYALGKVSYPSIFNFNASYIEAALFIILAYYWKKKKA